MFKLKLFENRELGLISPERLKIDFMLSKINYSRDHVSLMKIFTEETVNFLYDLPIIELLKLYFNEPTIFSAPIFIPRQHQLFKEGIMNNFTLSMRLKDFISQKAESIPLNFVIPILSDIVMHRCLPTAFLMNLIKTNENIRNQINERPAIVAYLRQCNRNQHYIWGDLLADVNHPDVPSSDVLVWPMRGLHI